MLVEHDLRLLALAVIVCISGCLISLRLFDRALTSETLPGLAWLFMAGVAAGSAIWSTHFIAVLAFQPGTDTAFDGLGTLASLLLAIFGTTAGFIAAAQNWYGIGGIAGGAVIGLSIGAMHYTGMTGFRFAGHIEWDRMLVMVSVLLGTALSITFITILKRWRVPHRLLIAAGLFTLAICSLHFTAMTAAVLLPDPSVLVPSSGIDSSFLALAIGAMGLVVIGMGFCTYALDDNARRSASMVLQAANATDTLTDLPNRAAFRDEFLHSLTKARTDNTKLAVLMIDLVRLGTVNDTYGNMAGDSLLKQASRRMRQKLRPGEMIARISGDEFAVIQIDGRQPMAALDLAERLQSTFAEPFPFEKQSISMDASIGVSIFPDDATQGEVLLNNADIALLRARAGRDGRICFFERTMDDASRRQRALERELKLALARNEFQVHYQIQRALNSGTVTGFEALLRWNSVAFGSVSPAEFIPVAEEAGIIDQIGEWVLQTACRDAASWPSSYRVAVNLSPLQLQNGDLDQIVQRCLSESGLEASRLELEVTESVFIRDHAQALRALRALKKLGVAISLDDFGTGYSSLATLEDFPFDKLKLDRAFLRKATKESRVILHAVIGLGKKLNMVVLVEGIETEADLAFLRREGCDEIQGFLIGKPAPQSDIVALMADEAADQRTRRSPTGALLDCATSAA
jgi:diguanylate cyclase (GGDEF)-like protein